MEEFETDALVIGAGSCGSYIGVKLRERGIRVSLVEMERDIGGLVRDLELYKIEISEIPKPLSPQDYIQYLRTRIMELGIPLHTGTTIIDLIHQQSLFTAIGVSKDGVKKFRSKRVIIATGGREINQFDLLIMGTRPAGIFTGLMALRLINKFKRKIGKKAAIYTNNDIGLEVALKLSDAGIDLVNIITNETSSHLSRELLDMIRERNVDVIEKTIIIEVHGLKRLESVTLRNIESGEEEKINVDTLAISMGFLPDINLISKIGVKIDYEMKSPVLTRYLESSIPNLFIVGLASKAYKDINKAINDSKRLLLSLM